MTGADTARLVAWATRVLAEMGVAAPDRAARSVIEDLDAVADGPAWRLRSLQVRGQVQVVVRIATALAAARGTEAPSPADVAHAGRLVHALDLRRHDDGTWRIDAAVR